MNWIIIEDGCAFPKEGDYVLVYERRGYEVAWYDGARFRYKSSDKPVSSPTHWCFLNPPIRKHHDFKI